LSVKHDNNTNNTIHRILERSLRLLRGFYNRFVRIRGTPRQISLGLALGVFIGMSPFMGFHTVVAVMLASLVKWSKIAAGVGVFITNPFTAPFIYPLTYRLGAEVTGFSDPSLLRKLFESGGFIELIKDSPMIIVDLIVGGIVIGLPLAAISYSVAFHLVTRARMRMKRRKARQARHLRALPTNDQSKQHSPSAKRADDGSPSVDGPDRMAV
jgi:uncharacterized protein (DUF2062 family)